MADIEGMSCCGIREIHNIRHSSPKETVVEVAENLFTDHRFAFAIFSDTKSKKHGEALTRFIRSNKLGVVKQSNNRINGNTGNNLRVYLWELSVAKLEKYWKKHRDDDDLFGDDEPGFI